MISFKEALQIVQNEIRDYGTEQVPLMETIGRVLREELKADRDFPPYNRVTMDGIAIDYQAFAKGQRSFKIEGVGAAGAPQLTLKNPNNCLEIMTGAILPLKTDTVIRYEDVEIKDGIAHLQIEELKQGKNVHLKGEDRAMGSIIVSPGKLISPAEIGVAATIGKSSLEVSKVPKTSIISTGDELVEVDQTPLPHQIRKSNVIQIKSALLKLGIDANMAHLVDEMEGIKKALKSLIEENDVLIFSGGVSKGKFDYLPEALDQLKVEKLFHKVKQRPGKPFWFGKAPNGCLVFALPGNPVSSFMCTTRYVIPWLETSLQISNNKQLKAKLAEDYFFKPALTYFLQVAIHSNINGQLVATPITGNGSGDLANLVNADGFLQLPPDKNNFEKGEVFPLFLYR